MSILKVIAKDNSTIPYRKELNVITGGVTATILLQQLIYWSDRADNKPFYKFIEPCENELYNSGDSWVEELGFSKYEFKTAYEKLESLGIVSKKINMMRVTFYTLDIVVLRKLIKPIYVSEENQSMQSEKTNIAYSKNSNLTETTTETTSKERVKEEKKDNNHVNSKAFNKLNSYQKIDVLRSELKKNIGYVKLNIHNSNMLDAKELVEQIEDPEDFIAAYVNHKETIKDKKYIRGLFAFMAGYVEGEFKSPKNLEDDYVISPHPSAIRLDDGMFMGENGSVINPFTGELIPDYWENKKERA